MRFGHLSCLVLAMVFAFAIELAWPAITPDDAPTNLAIAQIVEQIQRHNLMRTQGLKQYKSLRHYQVEYRGFAAKIGAKMDVEINYDAAMGKSFRIVSESGSSFLRDKVLKRALDSEKEASQDRASTALTEVNYRFQLVGIESVAGRPNYILDVQPLTASKFLYRGRIWVDAAEFAVVKMETEPAKNPSFWISRTLIHSTSTRTAGFWLPEQLRSETKVRIGGTAVLTINYGKYEIVSETAFPGAGSPEAGSPQARSPGAGSR